MQEYTGHSARINPRIARPTHRLKLRDARFDRRKRREGGVGLGLMPIGDGIIIVGAMIGVAVLNGGAD